MEGFAADRRLPNPLEYSTSRFGTNDYQIRATLEIQFIATPPLNILSITTFPATYTS